MRATRLLVALAMLLATLAASGCVAAGAQNPANFRAADIAPADTWLFFATTTRPAPSQILGALAIQDAFTSQPGWDAAVANLTELANPTDTRVDLAHDVLPLLTGELGVAVYGQPSGDAQALVFVESDKAMQLASLGALPSGTTRTYKQASIVEYGSTVAAAYKGWAIFGNDAAAIEATIDRLVANTPGLGQQARFRAAAERLPRDKVALWYLDTATVASSSQGTRAMSPDAAATLQAQLPSVAMSAVATMDGLDFHLEASGPGAGQSDLFGNALFAHAGNGLNGFSRLPASTLVASSGAIPPGVLGLLNALSSGFLAGTGSDMELPDIHPEDWMTGEFALGMSPGSLQAGFLQPSGLPGFFATAGVYDEEAARRDLELIQGLLPPDVDLQPVDVADYPLQQLTLDGSDTAITYGVADNWLYAIGGGGDPADVVTAAQDHPLPDANPRFGQVRRALRTDAGNLFMDLQGGRELVEQLTAGVSREVYEREVRPFIAPLRALGGSSWVDGDGLGHAQFFLAIRK